jgi:hypothetical protein
LATYYDFDSTPSRRFFPGFFDGLEVVDFAVDRRELPISFSLA